MAEESKGLWGTFTEATGIDKILGAAGSVGGYLATRDNPDIPDISYSVDESLFDTGQADTLFEGFLNEFRSEQRYIGGLRRNTMNTLNRQTQMIDALIAERGSIRNMPSQVQKMQDRAMRDSVQNAASLSATIGGANAGLQQMNLQNQMAGQQLKIAEQGAELSIQEQMERERMEMARDQNIMGAIYGAGQLNIGALGGSRSGISSFGQGAGQGASLGANIRGNLHGARERYDDSVMGRYNAEVERDIREDQQIQDMIGGVTDSIAGKTPKVGTDSRIKKK